MGAVATSIIIIQTAAWERDSTDGFIGFVEQQLLKLWLYIIPPPLADDDDDDDEDATAWRSSE